MKAALFLTCVSLASCATPEQRPEGEIAASNAAIEEATREGAIEHAANELNQAQDKLLQAQAALQREDYTAARRLAEQAEADAKLAGAKSQAAKTQHAAAELNERIRDLRAQMLGRGNERK